MTDSSETSQPSEGKPIGTTDQAAPIGHTGMSEERKALMRERLAMAHEKMAEKRAAGWKPVVLNPVEKAKANPGSVKMAVKAHCWTCSGAGADPGVKLQVRDCGVKTCNLWPHRPWQTAKGRLLIGEDGVMVAEGRDADDASEVSEASQEAGE